VSPSRSAPVRARAAVALLTGSVLLGGLLPPLAHADDLKDKRHRVEKKIAGAHDDLDESSAQVRKAAAALIASRAQLATVQERLADTRGQLTAARALDEQTAARLAAATTRLRQARAELAAGRRKIADQRDLLGRIVVQNYQDGDPSLMGLSMVLTSQDPTELTGQLNSVGSVMDKESVVLDRLDASRSLLTVQEHDVAAARAVVARARARAAADLRRTQALEASAEAAETAVSHLVAVRADAEADAEQARHADLAELRALDAERARISRVLARRAAAARARTSSGPVRSNGFLDYPVQAPVTSPFGWRIHPIYGYRSLHDGIDFGAACGTPIRATADGTVVERYFATAWGNRVIIDHGVHRGVAVATISNHMVAPALVASGQHVHRGQVIGYVGTTGWSTGCHLHFTVLQNGTAVNPTAWF